MAQKGYRKLADIENPHRAEALRWALEAAGIPYLKHEHYNRKTVQPLFHRFYVKQAWEAEAMRLYARLEPSPQGITT